MIGSASISVSEPTWVEIEVARAHRPTAYGRSRSGARSTRPNCSPRSPCPAPRQERRRRTHRPAWTNRFRHCTEPSALLSAKIWLSCVITKTEPNAIVGDPPQRTRRLDLPQHRSAFRIERDDIAHAIGHVDLAVVIGRAATEGRKLEFASRCRGCRSSAARRSARRRHSTPRHRRRRKIATAHDRCSAQPPTVAGTFDVDGEGTRGRSRQREMAVGLARIATRLRPAGIGLRGGSTTETLARAGSTFAPVSIRDRIGWRSPTWA